MMRWTICCAALALLAAALPCPTTACSLCDSSLRARNTLREELEQAKVALYCTVANPQFNKKPGAPPGSGTTEFHLLRPVLDDAARGNKNTFEIGKYLPVPDPADPPKFILFCSAKNG